MIKNTNEKQNRIYDFTVLFYNKLAEINEETFPLGMITTEFLNITKEQVDKFTDLLTDAYKVLDKVCMKSSFIHLSPYSKGNFKDFEVAFKKLLDVVNTLPLYKQLKIDNSDWIDRLRNVFHAYPKEDGYEELCKSLQSIQIIRDEIVVYQKYLLMVVDEFLEKAKLRNSHYYALALYDFLSNDKVQAELQKDKDMISARGILAGEIQLLDKQKSGQSTDAMAYNMKTLMKMLSLVKRGLNSNINAVAMPAASPKFYQFADSNTDMVKNTTNNTVGQAVSASRIIYSSDKMSETEAKNAIITDFNMVADLYPQFAHFLNFFVNKKTRKYKFAFKFSGCTYPFTREDMINKYTMLMDKGVIFAPRTYAKVLDMTPMEFDRLLEEGKYCEWADELTSMMQSIYTQSGKDGATGGMGSSNGGGRPNASDSQKADSTASK